MKEKVIKIFKIIGLGFLEPLFRLDEKPKEQLVKFFKFTLIPLITFILFLVFWNWGAEAIQDIQNDKNAETIFNNAKDKAVKQFNMSEEAATEYAKSSVDTFWCFIQKLQYLDDVTGDIEPLVQDLANKKKKSLKELGIKKKKREFAYSTISRIEEMPTLIRSSIKINKKKGVGESRDKVYLLFTEDDVASLPKDLTSEKYETCTVQVTPEDLYSIFNLGKYNYFYEMTYLPRPKDVWKKWKLLINEHEVEKEKEAQYYKDQEAEIAKIKASKKSEEEKAKLIDEVNAKKYPGYPTFFDQIVTSIITVVIALFVAGIFAIPIGILMGLSPVFKNAINPLVQLFKPVSPVVWYMIVAMIVNALIDTETALLPKAFTISFISVAACANWATMINTSFGVSSVSQDLLNVASVLQVKGLQKVFKVILPSAIPMIFTGLRITVTTSWMVLIAVELLAQNPGLGKFVWDEFQNGSSNSNAKIVVAMFVIGIIGFLLDRIMLIIQKQVSYDKKNIS